MINKQEAIERIESNALNIGDNDLVLGLNVAKHIINQINEPQKIAVPQFVADWLEVCKDNLALSLASSMNPIVLRTNNQHEKTIHWFKSTKNQEKFAKAWLFGYEIEKEKLYTVEIPNPNEPDSGHIVLHKDEHNKVYIDWHYEDDWKLLKSLKLTEAEIKEDFDWAWQFAEEVKE